jgi:hypothetical protein
LTPASTAVAPLAGVGAGGVNAIAGGGSSSRSWYSRRSAFHQSQLGILLRESLASLNALELVLSMVSTGRRRSSSSRHITSTGTIAMALGNVAGGAVAGRVANLVEPWAPRRVVVVVGAVASLSYAAKVWT